MCSRFPIVWKNMPMLVRWLRLASVFRTFTMVFIPFKFLRHRFIALTLQRYNAFLICQYLFKYFFKKKSPDLQCAVNQANEKAPQLVFFRKIPPLQPAGSGGEWRVSIDVQIEGYREYLLDFNRDTANCRLPTIAQRRDGGRRGVSGNAATTTAHRYILCRLAG